MIRNIRLKYIMLSTLALLKLIRLPNLLIIILTQYFTRIFLIGPRQQWTDHIADIDLFLLSLSTILIASAGYIINDYYDIKIDTINRPKRIVVGRILKRRTAMGLHIVLNALGILIGVFLSVKIAVVNIFAGFLLWFYSNYLKRLPFIGNFIVAFLTVLVIGVIAVYFRQNSALIYAFAVFAFIISLIREVIKDMADMKGDIAFGCKTLPIIWGIRRTKYLLYGLLAIFITALFSFIILSSSINHQPSSISHLHVLFLIIILFLSSWFIIKLVRADTQKKYNYLSAVCKFIMLCGIIGMAVISV
ncbi:MAG: prenyltransferase [Cytophagales bacterium]|nr:prenyltransferase [Cytophagales bacterium]